MQLGNRKKHILGAVVKAYIVTGEPVGSKLLAQEAGLGVSSATLRNEMAELAEMGYLEQPHTSAGRVPTQAGYRFYVDSLMEAYRLTSAEREKIDRLLRFDGLDLESVIEKSGKLLASLTGCAAISSAPSDDQIQVRRIEIAPAGRRTMLIVLLASSGLVKSRMYRAADDIDGDMLRFFSQLVNERLCGRTLREITPALRQELEGELYEYTFALRPVLSALFAEIQSFARSEVFLGGEANLLVNPEFDSGQVAELIRLLERREELARLVDGIGDGVNVRIGSELGQPFMQETSMIAAPYVVCGRAAGTIGIIGPTRMHYARLMSHIEYFSSVLSRLISEAFGDE